MTDMTVVEVKATQNDHLTYEFDISNHEIIPTQDGGKATPEMQPRHLYLNFQRTDLGPWVFVHAILDGPVLKRDGSFGVQKRYNKYNSFSLEKSNAPSWLKTMIRNKLIYLNEGGEHRG